MNPPKFLYPKTTMFDTMPPSWTVAVFARNRLHPSFLRIRSLSKVVALALIAVIAFTGVKKSVAADSSGSKGTIALSLKTITNDDFQKALADAVKAKVESTGYTFLLVTAGEQTAVSTQVNQMEDLIAKKVTGIILNPMDGNAVVPVLGKAHEAGIPVVIVDSPVAKGHEDLYITFVGTDNLNAGMQAGKQMVQTLGNKERCSLFEAPTAASPGTTGWTDSRRGLREAALPSSESSRVTGRTRSRCR